MAYKGMPKASTKEALTSTRCTALLGYKDGKEERCRRELTKEEMARKAWLCTSCLGMQEAEARLREAMQRAREACAKAYPAVKPQQMFLGDDL